VELKQDIETNPFQSVHLPVRDPSRLFGRSPLLSNLVNSMIGIAPPRCVSIYGPRRIGKTSIVLCAADLAKRTAGPVTPMVIYEDSATWHGNDKEQVLARLVRRITRLLGEGVVSDDPADALQEALESATNQNIRVTFVYDEIGKAARNPRLDEAFFSFMRGLATLWDVQYVTCSPEPVVDYWIGLPTADSTYFGLFVTEFIGNISQDHATQMLASTGTTIGEVGSIAEDLAGLPLLLSHASSMLWEQRGNGHIGPAEVTEKVLSRPESQAFLRQLRDWHETIGDRYSLIIKGAEALTKRVGDRIPSELRSYWSRIEPSAQKQIREAEDLYRRYRSGNESVTPDTICFLYGKALELQVRHTIVDGLSDCIPDSVDSLGQYGKQIKLLSKSDAPEPVRQYLADREVGKKTFERFGERVMRVAVDYRNPGGHDTSLLSARDVEDARKRVCGDRDETGLLFDAITIHWGKRSASLGPEPKEVQSP
jgi:hypothetical protein